MWMGMKIHRKIVSFTVLIVESNEIKMVRKSKHYQKSKKHLDESAKEETQTRVTNLERRSNDFFWEANETKRE